MILLVGMLQSPAVATSRWPVVSAQEEGRRLASKLGASVTIPDSLQKHCLYVRANDNAPQVELQAVATALRASVKVEKGAYVLIRTPEDDAKGHDAWAAERAKWIEERVAYAEKRRRDSRADEDAAAALLVSLGAEKTLFDHSGLPGIDFGVEPNASQLDPAGGLMLQAIRAIGVPNIAKAPLSEVSLFETEPKGKAVALPDLTTAIRQYGDLVLPLQTFKVPPSFDFPWSGSRPGIGKPAAAPKSLRLSVLPHAGDLQLVLNAFDEAGNLVGEDSFSMTVDNHRVIGPPEIASAARDRSPEAKVKVPADLVALAGSETDKELPSWITQPSVVEPLSVFASFALDQLMGSATKCAVADLSDGLVEDAFSAVKGDELNLPALQAVLERFDPYEKVQSKNFVVWRPKNPHFADSVDRTQLQAFVKATVDSGGFIDTRGLAKADPLQSRLTTFYVSRLFRRAPPNPDGTGYTVPWQTLPLIGAIRDEDWSDLQAGEVRTAGQLGVMDQLQGLFNGFNIYTDSKSLPARYTHPAELYGDAEFDQTPIRILNQSEPVYRMTSAHTPMNRWIDQGSGVLEVSTTVSIVDGTPKVNQSREQFEADCDTKYRFQTGIRERSRLQIGLPNGNSMTYPMPLPIREVSTEMAYSELPKELRDRTWEMVCRVALFERRARSGG